MWFFCIYGLEKCFLKKIYGFCLLYYFVNNILFILVFVCNDLEFFGNYLLGLNNFLIVGEDGGCGYGLYVFVNWKIILKFFKLGNRLC